MKHQLTQALQLRDKYKFGFNGKLKDNEIAGTGNSYDYGLRMFDPRLARFKSVDPLGVKFPWWSSYQFAGNSPIAAVDLDGGESRVVISENVVNKDGSSASHVRDVLDIVPHGPMGTGTLNATYTNRNGSLSAASYYYEGKTAEYSSFNHTESPDGRTAFEKGAEKLLVNTIARPIAAPLHNAMASKFDKGEAAFRKEEAGWVGEAGFKKNGTPAVLMGANALSLCLGLGEVAAGAKGLSLLLTSADVLLTTDDITGNAAAMNGGDGVSLMGRYLPVNGRKGLSYLKSASNARSVFTGVRSFKEGVEGVKSVGEIGLGVYGTGKGAYDFKGNIQEATEQKKFGE